MVDYEIFELGDLTPHRADAARSQARIQDVQNAQRGQVECDRLPDLVLRPALRQRMADRGRHGPRSVEILHHCPEHVGQWAVFLAEQHPGAPWRREIPPVTFYDQVEQQHRLVTEHFGIETLALVTGWSMGAG